MSCRWFKYNYLLHWWSSNYISYTQVFIINNRELYKDRNIFAHMSENDVFQSLCVCCGWQQGGIMRPYTELRWRPLLTDPSLSGVQGHSNEGKLHNLEIFIFIFIWTIPQTEMWSQNREREIQRCIFEQWTMWTYSILIKPVLWR